jgi:hypothetical protein
MIERTLFYDVQDAGGLHFWGGADDWKIETGESRRAWYGRLESWSQLRDKQIELGVKDHLTGIDIGHRMRETLAKCAEWHWFGYKGDDAIDFTHMVEIIKGKPKIAIKRPWSEVRKEDALIGSTIERDPKTNKRRLRTALTMLWSNPSIYPILYNLKNGNGRYYGIASDMSKEYKQQLNSKVPKLVDGKQTWVNIGPDHAWDIACGNLLIAIRNGFFKIDK